MPVRIQSRLATPRRRSSVGRRVRAMQTHVAALLREFRLPILGFVVATVGGGMLYGVIYEIIRGAYIPLIDRPYLMLQLMLIEAPETVPPELPLVAFWYGMPVLFIVLIGLGAADFLDLFFNREDNRDRWSEAIAMTYRNHAIILGAGHVGLRVVRDLHDLGMDVAVIDLDPHPAARHTLESMGVPCVMGDVRLPSTLDQAGLEHAEVFVACTGDDRLNLEVVMKVRQRNERVRIVARVWDGAIGERMERFGLVDTVMSAADLAAPAFAGAAVGIEITQTLQIAGEEYSSARLSVAPGSFLDGGAVGALEPENDMEVSLVDDGESVTVDPDPDVVLRAGHDVVIFAKHDRVLDVVARNRKSAKKR